MTQWVPQAQPVGDRLLVILGDIEMGAGGPADDFPHSDLLGDLILGYCQPPYAELAVDIVFNGDVFDLLKTAYLDRYPRHITADVAMSKMLRIAAAHPRFFEAMRRFHAHTGAPRRAHFVVGNHDAELLFPEVQHLLRTLTGASEQTLAFPGFTLEIGAVHVEHGSQHDPMFAMDPDRPFARYRDEQVLNIAWGSAALLDTVMTLQPLLHFLDRLKPKQAVFDIMPEVRQLLMGIFKKYWMRDFWKGYFGDHDPTKKLSVKMIKELVWRMVSSNPEVELDDSLQRRLRESDRFQLYVVGHQHQPGWWSFGDRKVLQSGALRNEYMITDSEGTLRPIVKTYVEAYLERGQPVNTRFVELPSPPPPPGYVPASIFDVLPAVRELLQAREAESHTTDPQETLAEGDAPKREPTSGLLSAFPTGPGQLPI